MKVRIWLAASVVLVATLAALAVIVTESNAAFAARQKDGARSESQPTQGFIIGAIGLGVVGGGLLWRFLEPSGSSERRSSLQLTPWTSPTAASASLATSF